jgi:hypothetical protein
MPRGNETLAPSPPLGNDFSSSGPRAERGSTTVHSSAPRPSPRRSALFDMSDAVILAAGGARKSSAPAGSAVRYDGLRRLQVPHNTPRVAAADLQGVSAPCRPYGSSCMSPRPASGEGDIAACSRRVDFEPPGVTSPTRTGSRSGSSLRQSVTCLRRERARKLCLDLESNRGSSAPARMAPHLLARIGLHRAPVTV